MFPFHALSLLPYRALYVISDCIYIILYHLVRYRRSVVRHNIDMVLKGEKRKGTQRGGAPLLQMAVGLFR